MRKAVLQLEMYRIQIDRSRHYESQRIAVSNLLVVVSAGLLAFVANGGIERADLLPSLFLAVLGAFGVVASYAHYVRSTRHGKRAAEYREMLDRAFPDAEINWARERGNMVARGELWLYRMYPGGFRLKYIWIGLHVIIFLMGLLLCCAAVAA